MYFSGTHEEVMIYFQAKVLLHSLLPARRKKGSGNGVTTLHASRGLLFHTHGPGAEICRYTKIRERKEEERGKHFCLAVMSSGKISAGSGQTYALIVSMLNTKSILCLLSDKCNLEE